MFSFLRTSLVHNSSEYIVLKFEIMHVLIFENDCEKKTRIDAQVRTHDVRIHVKPIAGCNSTVPEALAVASGCLGNLKLLCGEPPQIHQILRTCMISNLRFQRICF